MTVLPDPVPASSAAMVLSAGLRHAQTLAGVIALSGYLPHEQQLAKERSTANAGLPLFIAHGSVDPVVPQVLGMLARDFLRSLGHVVEWHSYMMAHQVCAEEIADLRQWLGQRITSIAPD